MKETRSAHWRFKTAVSAKPVDLCSSSKKARGREGSIVFVPKAGPKIDLVDCKACLRIVKAEMPELL